MQPVFRIRLPLLDLFVSQFAGAERIAPGQFGGRGVVGDRLDFEDMQATKLRDLFECQRAIVDQPGGGRMGHQGLGLLSHGVSPVF